MSIYFSNIWQALKKHRFYCALFIFCFFSAIGMGFNIWLGFGLNIITGFFLYLIIFNYFKSAFRILVGLNALIVGSYYAFGIQYGEFNQETLSILLATNVRETLEFLYLPLYFYAPLFFMIILGGLVIKWSFQNIPPIFNHNNKNDIFIVIFFIVLNLLPMGKNYLQYQEKDFFLSNQLFPVTFPYVPALIRQTQFSLGAPWNITKSEPKYKNFVLIIGESVNAQYTSLYHYPLNTTPFLKSIHGMVFENYIAPAPNTINALARSFYFWNRKKEMFGNNNMISLANSVGFKTHWHSNQEVKENRWNLDKYASKQAQIFEPEKPFNYDDDLLPIFKKHFKNRSYQQPNLFILHLNGSHSVACIRLREHQREHLTFFIKNKNASCYLETLIQTDKLIAEVVNELKQSGESYSLIYFSDHGAKYNEEREQIVHNFEDKQGYHVPFIKISSDDSPEQIRYSAYRVGFDFLKMFAQWIGVEEERLKLDYEFFSNQEIGKPIEVYNMKEMIPFEQLKSEPILLPN